MVYVMRISFVHSYVHTPYLFSIFVKIHLVADRPLKIPFIRIFRNVNWVENVFLEPEPFFNWVATLYWPQILLNQ